MKKVDADKLKEWVKEFHPNDTWVLSMLDNAPEINDNIDVNEYIFRTIVAERCVRAIRVAFKKKNFAKASQYYSELFDLFYTDESTEPSQIFLLKQMQFSFTTLLSDEIVYTLTDYLKGNFSTKHEAEQINAYLNYSINRKNNLSKDKFDSLKSEYLFYSNMHTNQLTTFFDFLKMRHELMLYEDYIKNCK